jgi:hypothetical protein
MAEPWPPCIAKLYRCVPIASGVEIAGKPAAPDVLSNAAEVSNATSYAGTRFIPRNREAVHYEYHAGIVVGQSRLVTRLLIDVLLEADDAGISPVDRINCENDCPLANIHGAGSVSVLLFAGFHCFG